MRTYLSLLILLALSSWAWAQPIRSDHTEAELVSSVASIQAGKPFKVALRLKMDDHWHTYWKNPGDSGLPTSLEWRLPEGFKASDITWPTPQKVTAFDLTSFGYEGEIFLQVEITPPAELSEQTVDLKAQADWLECEKTCIPGGGEVSLTLPVSEASPEAGTWQPDPAHYPQPLQEAQAGWDGDKLALYFADARLGQPPYTFFPAQEMTISAAAAQPTVPAGSGFQMTLTPEPTAPEKPKQLAGVMVGSGGAFEFEVPIQAKLETPAASPPASDSRGLLAILLLAFGGGMVLNLMPCVLPVLSLKVLNFVEHAKEEETKPIMHGAVFSMGVLLSFWALAGALLLLRASGEKIGWGFQLQSPTFVASLCLLFFLISLNLFGVFEIGESLTGIGESAQNKSGLAGSFWSGVLTTLAATPCTAPFMATAIGYTIDKSVATSLAVFTAVALGVAFPYFLLTALPGLLRYVPKPGQWMETFKQALAFPLVFTSVWLAWVVGGLEGVDAMAWVLCVLVVAGIGAWLWGRYAYSPGKGGKFWAVTFLVLSLWMLGGLGQEQDGIEWETFSQARVQEEVAAGKPVFVDFTADWCQSCKVNEKIGLSSSKVKKKMESLGVVPLKADWTRRDPEITEALASFGRNGVPLYVLYPGKGAKPVILPELLLPGTVLEALEQVEN